MSANGGGTTGCPRGRNAAGLLSHSTYENSFQMHVELKLGDSRKETQGWISVGQERARLVKFATESTSTQEQDGLYQTEKLSASKDTIQR